MWYKRDEAQKRFTLFFGSATLAGAFGGLLASAIEKMDGIHGLSGWYEKPLSILKISMLIDVFF